MYTVVTCHGRPFHTSVSKSFENYSLVQKRYCTRSCTRSLAHDLAHDRTFAPAAPTLLDITLTSHSFGESLHDTTQTSYNTVVCNLLHQLTKRHLTPQPTRIHCCCSCSGLDIASLGQRKTICIISGQALHRMKICAKVGRIKVR